MEGQRSLFQNLHHISLIVENLDLAVAQLERLGFGPFVPYPPLTDYVDLEVPDRSAFYALRISVCPLGPITLQVIEAAESRSIYGSSLSARGAGVFHLGFQVDDIRSAEAEARGLGLSVLSRGRRQDGSGFTYLETASQLGVTLLLRQSPPT